MMRILPVASIVALSLVLTASCSSDSGTANDGADGGSSSGGAGQAGDGSGGSSSGGKAAGEAGAGGTPSTGGVATGGAASGGEAMGGGLLGGAGGEGGAGGAEPACPEGVSCVEDCPDMLVNAGCADAKAETLDFASARFGACGHWNRLSEQTGWIEYDAYGGFTVDQKSRLGWVIRTNQGTKTRAEAEAFCDAFSVAGLADWRLPTLEEARSLAGGCGPTAPGGSCQLGEECLLSSCNDASLCSSCIANDGPNNGAYCRAEATICAMFHTSSACSDCGAARNWQYAPGNGNFSSSMDDSLRFPVCVMALPYAVPCTECGCKAGDLECAAACASQ